MNLFIVGVQNWSFFWLALLTAKVRGLRKLVSNHFCWGWEWLANQKAFKSGGGKEAYALPRHGFSVLWSLVFTSWHATTLELRQGKRSHNTIIFKPKMSKLPCLFLRVFQLLPFKITPAKPYPQHWGFCLLSNLKCSLSLLWVIIPYPLHETERQLRSLQVTEFDC